MFSVIRVCFLGRIGLAQMIPPIAIHFSVVCDLSLLFVYHSNALWLNHLLNLDAIWQIHLCGLMTYSVGLCVLDLKLGRGDLESKPSRTEMRNRNQA